MLDTKRIITNFVVGESSKINPIECYEGDDFLKERWYFNAVKTVIGITHGQYVKQLQLMNVDISMINLLKLLMWTPNLKLLKMFFVSQNDNEKPKKLPKFQEEDLPWITDVIMYECGSEMNWLMSHLPENSVKSFTLKTTNWDNLKTILSRQKSITKINLSSDNEEPILSNLLDDLKLSHLSLNMKIAKGLSNVIEQQSGLKLIDTAGMIIDSEMFDAISKLRKMTKLTVNDSGNFNIRHLKAIVGPKQFEIISN